MSETIIRQWNVLQKIPPFPKKISVRSIKESLEKEGVCAELRTLQRDLQLLSGLFPLSLDDRSKPYGWSWAEHDAGRHLPGFMPSVALSLMMAEKFLEPTFPKSQLKVIKKHFKQAEQALFELQASELLSWKKKIHIYSRGFHLQHAVLDEKLIDPIYDGLLAQKELKVIYFSKTSMQVKEYFLKPLGLIVRDSMIYLVAEAENYNHLLQLALHRFRDVEILGQGFEYPPDFDLEKYAASGEMGIPISDKKIEIELEFDVKAGSHLLETPINDSQKFTWLDNGNLQIKALVSDTKEFRWWLLSFGSSVKVIEPLDLRNEIIDSLHEALKKYQSQNNF